MSRPCRNLVFSWSVPIETLIKVSQPLCFHRLMIVPCFIKSSASPKDLHDEKGLDPIWCCMWRKIGHRIMHLLHSQPLLGVLWPLRVGAGQTRRLTVLSFTPSAWAIAQDFWKPRIFRMVLSRSAQCVMNLQPPLFCVRNGQGLSQNDFS